MSPIQLPSAKVITTQRSHHCNARYSLQTSVIPNLIGDLILFALLFIEIQSSRERQPVDFFKHFEIG